MTGSDEQRRLQRRLNTIPSLGSKTGVFVQMVDGLAQVNVGRNTIQIPYVGQYPAQVGEEVQLERRNGGMVVTGPANQRVSAGRVSAVTSPKLTILMSDGTTEMLPYDTDAYPTPAVNDEVAVDWFYPNGRVAGRLSITPTVVPPDVNPGDGPPTGHPAPFAALESGSFNPGAIRSDDVIFGESYNSAGFFYGSKIKDTIPDAATLTVFRVFISCRVSSGANLTLGVHSLASKPGSSFAVTSQITIPGITAGFADWVDLLAIPGGRDIGNFLKSNDGGLGTAGSGYKVLRGVSSDALSGAIDAAWG